MEAKIGNIILPMLAVTDLHRPHTPSLLLPHCPNQQDNQHENQRNNQHGTRAGMI